LPRNAPRGVSEESFGTDFQYSNDITFFLLNLIIKYNKSIVFFSGLHWNTAKRQQKERFSFGMPSRTSDWGDFPLLAEKGSIPPEIIDIYKH